MPGTYSTILLHLVFATKHRRETIGPDVEPRLYQYIGGIVRNQRGVLLAAGGMPDHTHLLVSWRPDESVSTLMRELKSESSRWMHKTFPALDAFAWQEGYSVFSVSRSMAETVDRYIRSQKEHHRTRTFMQELLELLRAHGVEFDERYVFD
jgi:REP element-mobilizing transposase RayT